MTLNINRTFVSLSNATRVARNDHKWEAGTRCPAHWTLMLCDCNCGANDLPNGERKEVRIKHGVLRWRLKNPSELTPEDDDWTIFDSMFIQEWVKTSTENGTGLIWSKSQDRWLGVKEYAAEWRRIYIYNSIMGDPETVQQMNREGL